MDYLVFRLYGAMASWGEIAVGESRHSTTHPSKSAIFGLMAAAIGIKREDEQQQLELAAGYHIAVKQLTNGTLLKDYHTTQAPDSVGKFTYKTRRDELTLGYERLGTVLSSREYRTDSVCLVAIKVLDDAPYELTNIQQKLLKPVFHLYLGRKSCPLSAPLDPQIITGQGYKNALDGYDNKAILPDNSTTGRNKQALALSEPAQYYWEGELTDLDNDIELQMIQTNSRYDQISSRKRWQFKPRLEHSYQEPPQKESA
ncbi:type I-E CRISPR-associated protein Cas5/CasD [Thalassomonas haliotis]|uniref:Type I-E CRISPR-associated protein Cas5/CasD n=1 Tax=Thalassomonas haliotis TaxID=485448 RepID=A0ABY7VI40_9GAMM|nr:type I-E CRISPR-associated protein Cas5/CasD [Thalassomonas haliotis]WDE12327.1 type I-E CRISPR-associated protein Cas5/CasD [Thalassomonas haliotis]